MKQTAFALQVQHLSPNNQVLVLCDLASRAHTDQWFSEAEITRLFEAFRIPEPVSVSRSLGQLRATNLLRIRDAERPWAITPLGCQRVSELVSTSGVPTPSANDDDSGAMFAHQRHSTIPPILAPVKWQIGINRFLEQFPFEQNVFLMTRYPRESSKGPDPLHEAISIIRSAVAEHGLVLHLASDRQIEDDLFGNVGAHIWACKYGIGILECRSPQSERLNENMLIELGSMLVIGRRCAMLRDKGASVPPSDFSGQIYKTVDLDDMSTISTQVHRWISEDLSL